MAGPMQNLSNAGSPQHSTYAHLVHRHLPEHSPDILSNTPQAMGQTCPFTIHEITQNSTASRIVSSIVYGLLHSHGSDLGKPFKEACVCPMMRCVQAHFRTPFDLLMHLHDCPATRTGEVRCTTCGSCHTMKKKGHAHIFLKSPATMLQSWSVRRNAKQGRPPGPMSSPTSEQTQETDAVEESDSSSGTDPVQISHSEPQQLQSEPHIPELQGPNIQWHPPVDSVTGFEKESWGTPAPVPGQTDGTYNFRASDQQHMLELSFTGQESTKQQSWDDSSRRSTLFEASPSQDMKKQLSIDMISHQSPSGSYHDFQYSPAGRAQLAAPTSNRSQWFPTTSLTESPEGVEPSLQGRPPWLNQNNIHGHGSMSSSASELEGSMRQYTTRDFYDASTVPLNAAVETATRQLRSQIGGNLSTMQSAGPGSMLPPGPSQRPLFGAGNSSGDSYASNNFHQMDIDPPHYQTVTNETIPPFPERTCIQEPAAPARRPAAKFARLHNARQNMTDTDKIKQILADMSKTPRDQLECPLFSCNYRPRGKHIKNYRPHFERHLRTHDINATWKCPLPDCTQEISGARKDNVHEHLRRKHPDATLENVESAGRLNWRRRQPKRRIVVAAKQPRPLAGRNTLRHDGALPSDGSGDYQSCTVVGDSDHHHSMADVEGGVVGYVLGAPDNTLLGISGGAHTSTSTDTTIGGTGRAMERMTNSGGLPHSQQGEDDIILTRPTRAEDTRLEDTRLEDIMNRHKLMAPWTSGPGGGQGISFGGPNLRL